MTSLKLRAGARSTTVATVIAISALLGGGVALADSGVSAGSTSPAVVAPAPNYGCTEAEQAAKQVQQAQTAKAAADKAVQTAQQSGDTAAIQKALADQKKAADNLNAAQANYEQAKDCSELPTHGSEIPGGTFPTHPTSGGVDSASETPGTPGSSTPGGSTPGSGVDSASTTPGGSGDSSESVSPGTPGSGVAAESTSPCEESTPGGNTPGGSHGTPGGNTPGGSSHSCTPCEYTAPGGHGNGSNGAPGSNGSNGSNGSGAECANSTPGAEVVTGRNPADVLLSASSQMLRWAVGIAGLILIALGAVTVVARRKALLADGAAPAKVGAIVTSAIATAREQISRMGSKRG
ncbi:hypothetical protein [Smaragdicoccus niigatensis]|uniref:hypothetical protein n=1 Tax=Smaragdicoccus niigatensis TaxID=359359 RepID=UPI0004774AA4|nr:hypothetical protein [Smaragdicoccus niigatensis]